MILGLDISTTCIGWCKLTDQGEYVDVGYINLSKERDLYAKLDVFRSFLKGSNLPSTCTVFVEAPLARSNNQNVVNLLQRWNGMCCVELYRHFESRRPILIGHRTARKLLGIKIPKGVKDKAMKNFILQHVRSFQVIPEEKWKTKRTGNPQDYCYDMCDSYVVARAGYEEEIKPKTSTVTE